MDDNGIVDLQGDPDSDGLVHLIEFAFGTDPFQADAPQCQTRFDAGWFVTDFSVRNGADGILTGGEVSRDLEQ